MTPKERLMIFQKALKSWSGMRRIVHPLFCTQHFKQVVTSAAADHAASHIGKVAEKHGLLVNQGGQREIRMDSHEGLCNAVFQMASVANLHLSKARELFGTVPAEVRPVLLPAVPAEVILDALSHVQFDVFDPRLTRGILGIPPLWFQMKLKWYSLRGKY